MSTAFQFRAVASDGKLRTGTLTAETEKIAAQELKRQGLIPVFVGREEKRGFQLTLPVFKTSSRRDVLFFTQELSTLLNAGVPVDRALSITAELTERSAFRAVVLDIVRLLKGGKALADSIAAHPTHFSELYINMVRAGEASGSLSQIFERLAEFERTRDDLRGYIVSSLIYPGLLTAVGCASIFILLNFVVPRFAQIFADPRIKIPTPTLIMLETSRYMREYWLPAAIVIGAAILIFVAYIRTPKGAWWWDSTRLRLPVLGDALRKAETSQIRARHGDTGGGERSAGAIARHLARHSQQPPHRRMS